MPIVIPQPSMALNAAGVEDEVAPLVGKIEGFYRTYAMWQTWRVGEDITIEHLIDHVANVADGAPDHYLKAVVINAHGSGAYIHIGRELKNGVGFRSAHPDFVKWKDRVANIWFMSCRLVNQRTHPRPGPPQYNDGNLMCSAIAKLTGAYVVASQESQPLPVLPLPWGCVPDWEGRVFRYEPDNGSVDWFHNYDVGGGALPPPLAIPRNFRIRQGRPRALWEKLPEPPPLRRIPPPNSRGYY